MKKAHSIAKHLQLEHYLLAGSVALLFVLIAFYIYFLSATVVQVVMHKEIQQEISEQHSVISSLEAKYIALQHDVSDTIASLDGFVVTEDKIFIDRSQSVLVLHSE